MWFDFTEFTDASSKAVKLLAWVLSTDRLTYSHKKPKTYLKYTKRTITPLCVIFVYSIGCLESQGRSCSIQPIAMGYMHLTVDGCTATACLSHIQLDVHWLWLSDCNVTSCKYVTCNNYSPKPLQHRFSPWSRWPLQTLFSNLLNSWDPWLLCSENRMILYTVAVSQYTRITDDRRHAIILWQKRNFTMRLQRSAKSVVDNLTY